MVNYKIRFIFIDHSSDECSPKELTIVQATDEVDAVRVFYADGTMAGCYIKSISLLDY